MPLPDGARVRVKVTKSGDKVRLAFAKGTDQVIEAKKLPAKNAVAEPAKREGSRGVS